MSRKIFVYNWVSRFFLHFSSHDPWGGCVIWEAHEERDGKIINIEWSEKIEKIKQKVNYIIEGDKCIAEICIVVLCFSSKIRLIVIVFFFFLHFLFFFLFIFFPSFLFFFLNFASSFFAWITHTEFMNYLIVLTVDD